MSTIYDLLNHIVIFFSTYTAPIIGWLLSSMTQLIISRLNREKLAIKEYLDVIGAYFIFDQKLSSTKIMRLKITISRKNRVDPIIFPIRHVAINKLLETYWLSDRISTEQKFVFPKQLLVHAKNFILNDKAVQLNTQSFAYDIKIDTLIFIAIGLFVMLVVFVSSGVSYVNMSFIEIVIFIIFFILISVITSVFTNIGYYFFRLLKKKFFDKN